MRIRAARIAELPALQAIERAAGRMFCDIGMPEIVQYDPWPLPVMAARQGAGRLWVAAGEADEPVAYLMADLVDGCLQVEQVTVPSFVFAAWAVFPSGVITIAAGWLPTRVGLSVTPPHPAAPSGHVPAPRPPRPRRR